MDHALCLYLFMPVFLPNQASIHPNTITTFELKAEPLWQTNTVYHPRHKVWSTEKIDNSFLLSPTAWTLVVQSELIEKVFLNTQLKTTINTSINKLTNESEITNQHTPIKPHQLDFYVTDYSLVIWQTDYNATPQYIENYEHEYVLRSSIIPSDPIINSALLTKGDKITRSGSISLNPSLNLRQAYVFAVIKIKKQVLWPI